MSEDVVFVLLEKRGFSEKKYRKLLPVLASIYPATVLRTKRGKKVEKIVMYLKRHDLIWKSVFELVKWVEVKRDELSIDVVMKYFEERYKEVDEVFKKFRTSSKDFVGFEEFLMKAGSDVWVFFGLDYIRRGMNMFMRFRKRLEEYKSIPEVLRNVKQPNTQFLKNVRTSKIFVLKTSEIESDLHNLLWGGVIPLDYSKDMIIVGRKELRNGFWLSLTYDPYQILRSLHRPPTNTLKEVKQLRYEPREIGWGLTPE
jgi:hypothetical protein